jgi:hypothetical protein
LPAVLSWVAAWTICLLLRHALGPSGLGAAVGFGGGLAASLLLALHGQGRWRQAITAVGFPLSALALGAAASFPPWWWLLLVLPLLAVYPLRAWADAPFFPTDGASCFPVKLLFLLYHYTTGSYAS